MHPLFEVFKNHLRLTNTAMQALIAGTKRLELPKGHMLLTPGSTCNYIYFIEKGLTRTFYVRDGKDVTDWISSENTFSCSIISFITRKPDIRGIELLEPSVIWAISHEHMENLYREHPEIERFGRILSNSGLVLMQQRFDDLHFATATQRYQNLMQSRPDLLLRVPLGMVASFLGITQETLSRMRAQAAH